MFSVFNLSKYKLTAAVAAILVCLLTALVFLSPNFTGQAQAVVVAIDAGHGGYDGGVTGLRLHLKESDVNLSVAKYLEAYLRGAGYKTVMTRRTDRAPVEAGSLKRRDMDMRLNAIEGAKADLAVSVHCNFYPSEYRRGIQVFYDKKEDMPLAEAIQSHLNRTQNLPNVGRQFEPLWGDYYLLKNAPCPAAIVECGFLSNREDEALLADENYRMTLAYQIYLAIDSMYAGNAATPTLAL
ncbi:MAG: N-acetylmuramoyl-L-alanine amidase [Clostridia bacterium]|nr:N-acetylmuramoyl-L-alanine amidase [Clostridia bacterium]